MNEMRTRALRFVLQVSSKEAGAPVRWDVDLDRAGVDDLDGGWVDPDSWSVAHGGRDLPFRVDTDTLDGRRFTLRFRVPAAGEAELVAACTLRAGPRPAPEVPPARPIPLVGAGEALSLGSTGTVGDLQVGLQTVVDAADWYGRGRLDLLLCCLGHEGGAFVYAATDGGAGAADGGRPVFRRVGRLPGFGDDGQSFSAKLRAVDFRGDGRFDLLECRGSRLLRHRNVGVVGAPAFASPQPVLAGGAPFDVGARSQMVCPVDLEGARGVGGGPVSLIVGTNDWTDYWPKDVGAWEDKPGYRPYEADGTWRGGPMRGRLYLLRKTAAGTGDGDGPSFAAPVALCHADGTPLEVYGLAGPVAIRAAVTGAAFDLVVSDFLDRLWYFRNTGEVGPDGAPRFAPRTPVRTIGAPPPAIDRTPGPPIPPPANYPPLQRLPDELALPTCMHAVTAVTWPGGATDFLVAAEDGYVRALRLVSRTAEGVPVVGPPERLQEYGARLSVGAKACPNVVDWDGDGRDDLVIGNAAGQVLLCRNAGTNGDPVYATPVPFLAGERPLWLMAGAPGTMQGPSEVKWGYINPAVGLWPQPNRPAARAIVCGDALGNNTLYLDGGRTTNDEGRTDGGRTAEDEPAAGDPSFVLRLSSPHVSRGRRLHLLREGRWEPLVTRWRCRPQLVDWGDGETVYLQVAEDGTLTCYRILADGPSAEDGDVHVAPLDVLRHPDGAPVRLDSDFGGRIGRIKLAVTDWDGDGLPDLLMGGSGSQPHGRNPYRKSTVFLLRNVGASGKPVLAQPEAVLLDAGEAALFGGHSCVPAPCRLDGGRDGRPDLLVGSENGRVYAFRRSYVEARARVDGVLT